MRLMLLVLRKPNQVFMVSRIPIALFAWKLLDLNEIKKKTTTTKKKTKTEFLKEIQEKVEVFHQNMAVVRKKIKKIKK